MQQGSRVLAAVLLAAAAVTVLVGGAHAQLPQPDLNVVEVYTEPDPPEPGKDAEVFATIRNDGDVASNGFNYNFTLNGQFLGQVGQANQGLDVDETVTVNATAPWSVTAGVHTLNASVEHNDSDTGAPQDENPDNNQTSRTYTLGSDLKITEFTVKPKETVEGEDVKLTATIKNVANKDATGTFKSEFRVDDESKIGLSESFEGLESGSTRQLSKTWTAVEGDHTITAHADVDETVPDRNRDNNDAGPKLVSVKPARPDLVVGNVQFSPDPARPGEDVTFQTSVQNNGRADAGAHNISMQVDGTRVDTASVPSLAQGAQANVTLSWEAVEGNHEIEFEADPANEVKEDNDDNNVAVLDLAVGADLVIEDFGVQPSRPNGGDRVRFTVEVGNEGLDVTDSFTVEFFVDGESLGTRQIDGLASGEIANKTSAVWRATVGDHNASVTVDPGAAIPEVDTSNNARGRTVTVGQPRPDVTVLSAGLDPAAPGDGEEATVKVQVRNVGARAAGSFTLTSAVDGDAVGDTQVDGLDPGERTTVDVGTWTATIGPHELVIEADANDDLDEVSEGNNTFRQPFGIGADLAAVDLSVAPSEVQPGADVTATLLAANNGTVDTPELAVRFSLAGDTVGEANLSALSPNEQGASELTFTATRTGDLVARIDPDGSLDEFDEDNNRINTSLTVPGASGPPDLQVTSIDFRGDPAEDDTVTLTAVVTNVGEGPSPSAEVVFRVDGSTLGSPVSVSGLAAGDRAEVVGPSWEPTGGAQSVQAEVDPGNDVAESDDTNNALERSVETGPVGVPLPTWVAIAAPALAAIGGRRVRGTEAETS